MKHLEQQRISVREFNPPGGFRTRIVGHDLKTGYEYCQEVDFHEAIHHRELIIHCLRNIEDSLLSKRNEIMGIDWTSEEFAPVSSSQLTGKMKMQNDFAIASYRKSEWQSIKIDPFNGRSNYRNFSKFFRLGNEVELEEGATFTEPLDALRLSIARWLK